MPYTELYVHLVWATRDRAPLLDDDRALIVERAVRGICREHGAVPHAVGIMPDHLHLAASFPARLAIADLVRLVKGATSHLLNHELATPDAQFAWQAEYGALTFGKRSLAEVVAYVRNQGELHAAGTFLPALERIDRLRESEPAQ